MESSGDENNDLLKTNPFITPTIFTGIQMSDDLPQSPQTEVDDSADVLYVEIVNNQEVKKTSLVKKKSKEKTYTCHICSEKFANKSQVTVHAKKHEGNKFGKPYRCDQCNQSFIGLNHLKQHQRTHTGEKPFKCPICPKRFRQLSHVQQHARTHHSAVPYRCTYGRCTKAFANVQQLKLHESTHLALQGPVVGVYKCNWNNCSRSFTELNNLSSHVENHRQENSNLLHDEIQNAKNIPKTSFEINITDELDEEDEEDDSYNNMEAKNTFFCYTCRRVYSKESTYKRHVAICENAQGIEEHLDSDDNQNDILRIPTEYFPVFTNEDYGSFSGGDCGSVQITAGECMIESTSQLQVPTSSTPATTSVTNNCVDHIVDKKQLYEGQRFLRHMLKEMRSEFKKPRYNA